MTIDFAVRSRRNRKDSARPLEGDPSAIEPRRPARIAYLLALAHRFEGLLQSGAVKNYAGLARLGHVSRARITQIMNLLDLAPAIQEHLLGLHAEIDSAKTITEGHLRRVLREIRWDRQVALVRELISANAGRHLARRETTAPPEN